MKNFQETVFGDKNVNLLAAEPHITSLPLPAANYDAIMRQLKSTSRDLRRMFTADLTVLQIAERFSTIDANASTSEAIDLMHQRDFDVYGVRQVVSRNFCNFIQEGMSSWIQGYMISSCVWPAGAERLSATRTA